MNALVGVRRLLGLVSATTVAGAVLLVTVGSTGGSWPVSADGVGALRLVLAVYVSVLGFLVASYAATNLRGQARLPRFAVLVAVTVGGLLVMVTAEDLLVAAVGWTASGLATAALVAHRGDERSRRAARAVASRLVVSDLALWSAVVVWHRDADSAVVGGLLALAIVVRSALVPAHRWLPETAEAPSPISALLHAGVVNGGVMLALLFWPLVAGSEPARLVLIGSGLCSVALGLASMRLRPDVKGRLAASTTAQMGLAAVTLGLALPAAALVHVLGHGSWKAWLFLRAGGSVGRAKGAARRSGLGAGAARTGWALLAAAVALGTVAVGLAAGRSDRGLLLPAVLAGAVAAVGVWEAGRLERSSRSTRIALAGAAGAVPVCYLLAVAVIEGRTGAWFGPVPGGEPSPSWTLALAVAALVVAAGLLAARVDPRSHGPVATAVAATLLPPGGLVRGSVRGQRPAEPDTQPGGLPVDQLGTVVELAAAHVGPAWPLRSMVAASPLAPLEKLGVEDAAGTVRLLHGRDPRPRLDTFVDLYERGVITESAVRRALGEHDPTVRVPGAGRRADRPRLGAVEPGPLSGISPADLAEFTSAVAGEDHDSVPLRTRACDRVEQRPGRPLGTALELHAAAWTARAWGSAPPDGSSATDPWSLWRRSASNRVFDHAWGLRGASGLARSLPEHPALAIAALWPRLQERGGGQDLYTYLAGLLASARGWAGHARWRARATGTPLPLLQLVALHMVLDLLLAEAGGDRTRPVEPGSTGPRSGPRSGRRGSNAVTAAHLVSVWQRALDLSVRDPLLRGVVDESASDRAGGTAGGDGAGHPVRVQSVWCIDARSERPRRHVERLGGHETFGYAGFFGAAVRHRDADGELTDLCPGPLRASMTISEEPSLLPPAAALRRLVTRIAQAPPAAFGYAEMSGLPAMVGTATAGFAPAWWRQVGRAFTDRPRARAAAPTVTAQLATHHLDAAVDAAERLLRSTGLAAGLAPVLVLVGHGSSTENNAFASAYDCGACGGNSGSLNASLVATALNDRRVRTALAARGLPVPESTVVVAAAHDTTTDEVTLLRGGAAERPEVTVLLDAVAADLDAAGVRAGAERGRTLPRSGRRERRASLARRAADWAEPMPEWGLAGNMALVVGPRSLTQALPLQGAVFLHSYDPDLDPGDDLLEQIMIGPVVVTQWISSQYYFSAAAPELLGAGDKTTHNVVGDVGVITGAHGDLRTGLPWQAISECAPGTVPAGSLPPRHLPSRHLVVVAAEPDAVRRVVTGHAALYQAVGNGWMQLVAIPPRTGEVVELDRDLQWQPCVVPGTTPRVGVPDPQQ